jgi:hypothetical protein
MTCWLIAPTSGTGKVYVQDMTRGGLYLTTSGTTWQAASAVYGSGFQTSWQQIAGTTLAGGLVPPKLITLPSAAECGGPGVTLRVTLTATGGDCYFDEVEIYPAINACYIGGHNLGPHINVAVDGAPGLSLVPQPGGFYDYAADNIPDRTLTITFYGTPANPISIGNLWLGEVRELEQGVNYGYRVRRVERQQVSPDGTVHVLSDGPERVLEDLTFGCGSLEQFRDLVDTLLDPMRMMAYPALIIPDSSMYGDGLALVGRLDAPDWAETRRGLEPREVVVTIVEDELPTETA